MKSKAIRDQLIRFRMHGGKLAPQNKKPLPACLQASEKFRKAEKRRQMQRI